LAFSKVIRTTSLSEIGVSIVAGFSSATVTGGGMVGIGAGGRAAGSRTASDCCSGAQPVSLTTDNGTAQPAEASNSAAAPRERRHHRAARRMPAVPI
jgi:hypothetical protein